MIGYKRTEISSPRQNWADWLRGFHVGHREVASHEDAQKIRSAIVYLCRRTPGVKFKTKTINGELTVIREA